MRSKNPEDLDRFSPYRADLLQVFLTSYPLEDYDRDKEIRACDRLIKKYTFEKAKAMAEYAVSDQYPHFLRKATHLEKYQDQVIEHKKVNDNYE